MLLQIKTPSNNFLFTLLEAVISGQAPSNLLRHGKFIKKTVHTQPAITCSKLTIKTVEQGVKYLQS